MTLNLILAKFQFQVQVFSAILRRIREPLGLINVNFERIYAFLFFHEFYGFLLNNETEDFNAFLKRFSFELGLIFHF